jgi:acetoin utilization protein AcuB
MMIKTLLRGPAVTVEARAPLEAARDLMSRRGVAHVPVVEGAALVGLLRECDALEAGPSSLPELERYDWREGLAGLRVDQVMDRQPLVLAPDTPVTAAARLARARGVDGFPVVEGGEVLGVVTTADLTAVLVGLLEHRQPPALGNVLAAVSLGASARDVVAEALGLASVGDARLTLLHVLPSLRRFEGVAGVARRIAVLRRSMARDALESMAADGGGVRVACAVAEGDVLTEVVRAAVDRDADLVVMGGTGGHRVRGLLSGSLAEAVARRAPCPVLAVPSAGERRRHARR